MKRTQLVKYAATAALAIGVRFSGTASTPGEFSYHPQGCPEMQPVTPMILSFILTHPDLQNDRNISNLPTFPTVKYTSVSKDGNVLLNILDIWENEGFSIIKDTDVCSKMAEATLQIRTDLFEQHPEAQAETSYFTTPNGYLAIYGSYRVKIKAVSRAAILDNDLNIIHDFSTKVLLRAESEN